MKILIIEDSALYRKIHAKLLNKVLPDAELITAGDGWEGYQLFEKEKPDYILLDLLMPVMSGVDFLRLLRDKHPATKSRVIVLSADVQRVVKEEVMELGVQEFIHKPFTEEKALYLSEVIRRSRDVE
ncbi:Response regulator receiver domain-containing protein [Tindallia magadiensis]|uniref:Stage 0 sporulation protein A homolog n=1 Tax=Tindallia magadiensis TaxID=69895 RepID=A0A1I3AF96_9FIRM|nr:response regulator [Tindallia magadiensis]SFH48011.1 Response regulator receiver domain-containing protein [Tindallia magadiensis]